MSMPVVVFIIALMFTKGEIWTSLGAMVVAMLVF